MAQAASKTSHTFRYALYISGVSIAIMLISFVFDLTGNNVLGVFNWIAILALLHMSAFRYREDFLGGYISFGKSFSVIFQTAIFYGLIMMFYSMIHYQLIDPGALDEMMQIAQKKLIEAGGITQAQLDAIVKFQKNVTYTYWGVGIGEFLSGLFWGLIAGLLLSLINQKDDPNRSPFKP
ncbi:MAG: DUF4199 domain-containing protein [Bacteroidales bacterium]